MPGLKAAPLPKALAPPAPKGSGGGKLTGAAKERATLAPPKTTYLNPKAPANPIGKIRAQAGLPKVKAPTPTITSPFKSLPSPKPAKPLTNAQLNAAASQISKPSSNKPLTPAQFEKQQASVQAKSRAQNLITSKHVLEAGFDPTLLVKQVLALPKTTGEGLLETAGAIGHDLIHPVQTIEHPLHSATFNLGKNIVVNDPVLNAIEQGSLKPIQQNPLGTILDATVVGGALGKAAEMGMLGDRAAAAFERAPIEVPGTNTVRIRKNYSINPIVHGLQRLADSSSTTGDEGMNLLPIDSNQQEMNAITNRVDMNQHTGTASLTRDLQANDASLNAANKLVKGTEGAKDLVGHFEQMLPKNPATARKLMADNLNAWKESLAKHEAAKGDVKNPDHLDSIPLNNLHHNIKAMENGAKLSDADLQKAIDAAKLRQEFQTSNVEQQRATGALTAEEQMARRAVVPYAQRYLGAVHTSQLGDKIRSEAGVARQDLQNQLKDEHQELSWANKGTHPELKPIVKNVNLIKRQIERAKGAKDAERLAALRKLRDEAITEFKTARQGLRIRSSNNIEALNEQLDALHGKENYLKGWVVPVEHGPTDEALRRAIELDEPIHGLSSLGQNYKLLDTAEAMRHAQQHGITPGYLSGAHLDEAEMRRIRSSGGIGSRSVVGRGGTPQPYLGESFNRGTFDGTLAGSGISAERGLRAVNRAQNWDRTLQSFGLVDHNGNLLTFKDPREATQVAQKFQEEHPGHQLSVVGRYPDRAGNVGRIDELQNPAEDPAQRYSLVHESALKRMDAHLKAQQAIPVLGQLNRLWRGGVLPFSANYLQSVPQEGLLRTAMNGINPLRTLPGFGTHIFKPNDFNDMMSKLDAASKDESLDPATRAVAAEQHRFMTGLSGSGTMYGSQDQVLSDAIRVAKGGDAETLGHKLERLTYKPGRWQLRNMHKLENVQAKAVLNDWVKSAKKATGSQEALVKALLDGKNGANLAAQAARDMNDVLGNYLHRSPLEQTLIRNFTPFLPWYKNAVRFVYVTMPRDHPFMTAWLNNVGHTNASAWQQEHANLAPYLSSSFLGTKYGNALETVGGVDPMRNTPFGIGETSPLGEASLFEPSVTPALFGAFGLNGFGQPINTHQYGVNIQPGSTQALVRGVLPNVLGALPYYGLVSKAIEGATQSGLPKDTTISHNRALGAIENALGGSLLPKNYGVYGKGSSNTSSPFSSSGFGSGSFSSSGFGSGKF